MAEEFERVIFLNRLLSRSVSQAPAEFSPPVHGARELFAIIEARFKQGFAIEFVGAGGSSDNDDDKIRIEAGRGYNFIRVKSSNIFSSEEFDYIVILAEFVNQAVRDFPVVDTVTYEGREISGDAEERGAFAAHVLVRIPTAKSYDDASYRCAIEHVASINRRDVEALFSRQIRRQSKTEEWRFSVKKKGRKGKNIEQAYKYHPRLDLVSDVGRSLLTGFDEKSISKIVFTNRNEKLNLGQKTDIEYRDVVGNIDISVNASQGPDDEAEKQTWFQGLKRIYELRGYESKIYFRHVKGRTMSGDVHAAIAEATDLVMCPREIVKLQGRPRVWRNAIEDDTVAAMKNVVDNDALWARAK